MIFAILPMLIVYERKLLGRFQARYGPNRVGPFGLLQPLAEIVKFAMKEPFRTATSIGVLYRIAPMISIVTAVAAMAIIPFGNVQHVFGQEVGLYGIDVSIGPLYVFALAGISFYGVMLGGWASGSKYAFLGAMRGAAQLISYEVSQALALVGVIITAADPVPDRDRPCPGAAVVLHPPVRRVLGLPGGVLRRDQPGAV